ncbi:hypothetical protein HPB51_021552 [Rhipicephalus microplus]|uniref:CCHC-type domain-containing protein n=1 Tax=Rhipicephalus microplus TaxID=6941 RepID=A0A9J6EIJ4_RHIMP|nr:hypothetical protein HPB51_021552 [Rhipicephalus microplus]
MDKVDAAEAASCRSRGPELTPFSKGPKDEQSKVPQVEKVDDTPHHLKIAAELTLVDVPGRAPLCLWCKSTGHIHRDCRKPSCSRCRRFGHEDDDCSKTYDSVTTQAQESDALEHLMDKADSEETAGVSPNSAVQDGSSCCQEEGVCERRGKKRRAPLLPRQRNHRPKRLPLDGLSFGHGQTFRRNTKRRKRHLRHLKDCTESRRSGRNRSCKDVAECLSDGRTKQDTHFQAASYARLDRAYGEPRHACVATERGISEEAVMCLAVRSVGG